MRCFDVGLLYKLICRPAREMDFKPRHVRCFTEYDHRGEAYK
jgi:hypothetical protein